jgi:hypothetical protein
MNEVMYYLIVNSKPLIEEPKLKDLLAMPQFKWQNFADEVKGLQFLKKERKEEKKRALLNLFPLSCIVRGIGEWEPLLNV